MKKNIIIGMAVLLLGTMTSCGRKKEPVPTNEIQVAAEQTTEESAANTEPAAEVATVSIITGEVIDAAMNTVIIRTEGGVDLIFSKEDAEIDLKDGLVIGNLITIEYTGNIEGNDASSAKAVKISDVLEQ